MIRKILSPIIISVIQIVVLVIIHDSLNHFYPIQHRSVGFGLTLFLTGIIFMLCILAFNFYLEFFKRNLYWIAFWLLILLALFGFLSSLILSKWRMKINMKTETNF